MSKLHFTIAVGIGAWQPCGQHKEIKNKEEKMASRPQNGVEKKIKKKTIPEMVWERRKDGVRERKMEPKPVSNTHPNPVTSTPLGYNAQSAPKGR